MKKKILIALPAFNEAKHLAEVFKCVMPHQLDVLLVDDGSTDETSAIAGEFDIQIIKHRQNLGLSEVYKTFINYADSNNYTHIITLDSDGQHNAKLIPDFVDQLDSNQVIFGNRFSQLDLIPKEKLSANFFASLLTHSIYGHFLPDVSCGFRGFGIDFLKTLNKSSASYGIIYQTVFECLERKIIPAYVSMNANYQGQILRTNSTEIVSILEQAQLFSGQKKHSEIIRKIKRGDSFTIEILGIWFGFQPMDESTYVISTDLTQADEYYQEGRVFKSTNQI